MVLKNITEAKTELSKLIELVQHGEEVVVAKAGKAVVRIVLYEGPTGPRKPGALKGKIKIAADFDQLQEDMEEAFGIWA